MFHEDIFKTVWGNGGSVASRNLWYLLTKWRFHVQVRNVLNLHVQIEKALWQRPWRQQWPSCTCCKIWRCTSATLCFLFLCLRDRKMGACSPGVLLHHLSRVQSGRLFSAFVNIIAIILIVFSNIFIILIIAMFLTKHKEWLQSFWLPRRQLLDRVQLQCGLET